MTIAIHLHLQDININNSIFRGPLLASLLRMWPGLLLINKSTTEIMVASHKSRVSSITFVIAWEY